MYKFLLLIFCVSCQSKDRVNLEPFKAEYPDSGPTEKYVCQSHVCSVNNKPGFWMCAQDSNQEVCVEECDLDKRLESGYVCGPCEAPTCDCDGDLDNDGYLPVSCDSGQDCNDKDSNIFLGAPEKCDSKDNNCNGLIDEGCNTPLVDAGPEQEPDMDAGVDESPRSDSGIGQSTTQPDSGSSTNEPDGGNTTDSGTESGRRPIHTGSGCAVGFAQGGVIHLLWSLVALVYLRRRKAKK